ncbi:MAG TPA: hypothetical protein VHT53_12845 [Candidatus Elarobacter sp.]|jgi:tetratricopeptide (TPR) repeat protein|nr:hypothetical protein [Candidatus Elarobacter sp.]
MMDDHGHEHHGAHDDDDAYDPAESAEILTRVVQEHPDRAEAWYDLGLAHKYLGNWRESADANLRALEITSEPGDAAWWNLGIAATALRDWSLARRAWRGYGIDDDRLGEGDAPIEVDWGTNPVRIRHADGSPAEVVWGKRICPARIKIESIPLPESGHRWGDVILHDGAPNGERTWGKRRYPVFDELERWGPSEIATLSSRVRCARDDDSEALVEAFRAEAFEAEDWSTYVRPLCQECSEGNPDAHHAHAFPEAGDDRTFGIAAPPALAERVLRAWRDASPSTRDFEPPEAVG